MDAVSFWPTSNFPALKTMQHISMRQITELRAMSGRTFICVYFCYVIPHIGTGAGNYSVVWTGATHSPTRSNRGWWPLWPFRRHSVSSHTYTTLFNREPRQLLPSPEVAPFYCLSIEHTSTGMPWTALAWSKVALKSSYAEIFILRTLTFPSECSAKYEMHLT
jgi:hypothetical protein